MRRALILALVCLGLGVAFIATLRVTLPMYRVPTPSMQPTIPVGSLLVTRHAKRAWRHGDIVIHRANPGAIHCQRVVGVPGDRIRLEKRQLIRNGAPVQEAYTSPLRSGFDEYRDSFPQGETLFPQDLPGYHRMRASIRNGEAVVGAGDYFLLGDNRDNSADSRYFGYVSADDIVGFAVGVFVDTFSFRPL